jgi:hypothetical protein
MLNIQGDSHSLNDNVQKNHYKVINHKVHVHKLIMLKLTLMSF